VAVRARRVKRRGRMRKVYDFPHITQIGAKLIRLNYDEIKQVIPG